MSENLMPDYVRHVAKEDGKLDMSGVSVFAGLYRDKDKRDSFRVDVNGELFEEGIGTFDEVGEACARARIYLRGLSAY